MAEIKQYKVMLSGKEYVMVAGRLILAHEANPDALSIETELVQFTTEYIIFRAVVTTPRGRFTGHAMSVVKAMTGVAAKSPFEVAETSAVGRALGMAGYAIEGGIASAEEIDKAGGGWHTNALKDAPQARTDALKPAVPHVQLPGYSEDNVPADEPLDEQPAPKPASEKQVKAIWAIGKANGHEFRDIRDMIKQRHGVDPDQLTAAQASEVIELLQHGKAT